MSELKKLSKKLREAKKKFTWKVADEAVEPVIAALKASYPAEHVRTGAARDAIDGKPAGGRIRLKAGVRKRQPKSGKRRRRRSKKINYGQFLPWLLKDDEAIRKTIDAVMKDLDLDAL